MVDCLKQLSATLTDVVWVVTCEMLKKTDLLLIKQEEDLLQNENDMIPRTHSFNRIPIIRSRKNLQMIGESPLLTDMDDTDDMLPLDFILIKKLENVISKSLKNAKVKIVTVPILMIPRIYLRNYFAYL